MAQSALLRPARTHVGYLGQMVLFGGILGATSRAVIGLGTAGILTIPASPEQGLALAGLILLGLRMWPAVLLGMLLPHAQANGHGLAANAAIIGAGTLSLVVTAALCRRLIGDEPPFERLGTSIGYLALAGIFGPFLVATNVPLTMHYVAPQMQVTWVTVYSDFIRTALSAVLVTAPLLAWLGPRPTILPRAGRLELLGIVTALGMLVLLSQDGRPHYFIPTFPLLAWAALRTGARGATLTTLVVFVFTALTTASRGHSTEMERLLFFTGLNLTLGVSGILLAALVAEQGRSLRVEGEIADAYRTLIAATPFGVVGLDPDGRVSVWSAAAERMFGWRAAEVLGKPQPIIPPGLPAGQAALLPDLAAPVSGLETVRVRKDGETLDILLTAWPLFDGGGRPAGAMGVHQDITERKRAERLRGAIYRIAQAALTAPGGELYDAIHRIVGELMPAPNLYLGLYDPVTELLSFPYWADPIDPRPVPRRLGRRLEDYVVRSGRPLRGLPAVLQLLVDQGEIDATVSDTSWIGVPLRLGERTIGVLAVASRDPEVHYSDQEQAILEFVSSQVAMAIERRRAEEAVRRSEERFRVVATTTNDVVWEWDLARDTDWWSDTLGQILGYTPQELQTGAGTGWEDLVHPADRERVVSGLRTAIAGRGDRWRDEYRIRRRDGSYAYVYDRARILRDEAGVGLRVLGAMMDITERREAEEALRRSEEQLRQAMKMEAVGRLAGGVAHDFNNLLTSVLGHADLALNEVSTSAGLHDDLLQIRAAGTRAAALTQQLLAFSRKQVLEPRVVDINAVVGSMARMLRRTIGEDIELVTRLSAGVGMVRADPVQIEQVLLNLAVNARDAMPAGGRLTLETSSVRTPAGPMVRIRVEDTGIGMSEEVRAHLFEPFFTTKEVGKGTGLGLATVYGIVQQSGGTIKVRSTRGEGALFIIDLPQVQGVPDPVEREVSHHHGQGDETILLVEDEDSVRNLTRRVLELHGYQVLSAPGAEVALELSRLHDGPVHLLLTDVVMPGMSGPRLAEVLTTERPEIQLMFMSGYAATTLEQRILLNPDSSFLQKPFNGDQLIRRIRDVLDAVQA